MYGFDNLTFTKGFDECNLTNARQNNYAWAISDLNEHIYVATGRNILVNILKSTGVFTKMPLSLQPTNQDNYGEIWRYRKYHDIPWQRAFKISEIFESDSCDLLGFSYMICHRPYNGYGALYAVSASLNNSLVIYKTVSGVDWRPLIDYDQTGQKIKGNISRAMISKDGKIYLATVDNLYGENEETYLYSSEDPEFYPWKLETRSCQYENYDRNKNPRGGITAMVEFNNRIYVGTSTPYGAQVWRTNKEKPCVNDWTLVGCSGFGNEANRHITSMGVFNNSLYVGLAKPIPLAWIFPMGCDIAKIDKCDTWKIVVGSNPIKSTCRINENNSQQFGSGFNNPFNIYASQIKEYEGMLYITTFDNAVNIQATLGLILANIENVKEILGSSLTEKIINIYKHIIYYIEAMRYQFGFNLYTSCDGYKYKLISCNGIARRCGRGRFAGISLYEDLEGDLYLGTANAYQGCEVLKYTGEPYGQEERKGEFAICRCYDYDRCMEEKLYEIYDYLYELLEEPLDYLRCHWDEIMNNINKFKC